jgi:hypothetical protein
MGIRKDTKNSVLCDAGSLYGHNEMELGGWRGEYSSVFRDSKYTEAYLQHYPTAEPVEDLTTATGCTASRGLSTTQPVILGASSGKRK